jgi:hypothetical protein
MGDWLPFRPSGMELCRVAASSCLSRRGRRVVPLAIGRLDSQSRSRWDCVHGGPWRRGS